MCIKFNKLLLKLLLKKIIAIISIFIYLFISGYANTVYALPDFTSDINNKTIENLSKKLNPISKYAENCNNSIKNKKNIYNASIKEIRDRYKKIDSNSVNSIGKLGDYIAGCVQGAFSSNFFSMFSSFFSTAGILNALKNALLKAICAGIDKKIKETLAKYYFKTNIKFLGKPVFTSCFSALGECGGSKAFEIGFIKENLGNSNMVNDKIVKGVLDFFSRRQLNIKNPLSIESQKGINF